MTNKINALSYAGLLKLKPHLTDVENALIKAAKAGDPYPESNQAKGEPRNIRAIVLRFLMLGGDEGCKVDPRGVRLDNARITGELDLSFAKAKGNSRLTQCIFEQPIVAREAHLEYLDLSWSEIPSITLEGALVNGDVKLKGTKIGQILRLDGAKIMGQLDCENIRFDPDVFRKRRSPDGRYPRPSTLDRRSEMYLVRNPEGVWHDKTESELLGSRGYLPRFHAQRLRVERSFFFSTEGLGEARVDVRAAHVGDLVDRDEKHIPRDPRGEDYYELNGFTYDRIIGASLDLKYRVDWATAGAVEVRPKSTRKIFHPQPFTQLALSYRKKGYHREAKHVLYERDKLVWDYADEQELYESKSRRIFALGVFRAAFWFRKWSSRGLTGHGHYPERSLYWIIGLIVVTWGLSFEAWRSGSFAPNSGPVMMSPCWQALATDVEYPAAVWSGAPFERQVPEDCAVPPNVSEIADKAALDAWWAGEAPGRDWETFHPLMYAADVVIPIIDFGQTSAWAPSTSRDRTGRVLFILQPFLTLAGWALAGIGVTVLSRQIVEQ